MSEPLKPTNTSNDTHQDRPKEARPISAWKAFKETWQAEMKKAAAQSTQSGPVQPGANKTFQVIFTSVIMGLLIFGFIRFAVNTKQSAKEANNRELDLRRAQTQREPARLEAYNHGMEAGRKQLQKNYDVGGGLPLPAGQIWLAKNAVRIEQPVDEEAFIEGYIYAMKTVWEKTTGWKESNFSNIVPGKVSQGMLLYEYGMTEPSCLVVAADANRMLVKYFKNDQVEWKDIRATASGFFRAR